MGIKTNNVECISVEWFNQVGIVKGKDLITNEINLYIGFCSIFEVSEIDCIKHIMKLGVKINPDIFQQRIKELLN